MEFKSPRDIAGNTGPISLEDIEANYATLAELARAHNIRLIYSSVLPVHEYTERAGDMFTQRPPDKTSFHGAVKQLRDRLS